MKLTTLNKMIHYSLLLVLLVFTTAVVSADEKNKISLGVKILASNWKGKNINSNTQFEQNEGGQAAWNFGFSKGRFYTGLSLLGGSYNFTDSAPEQVTSNNTQVVTNVNVKRSELDLLAGYYFWDSISLFVDLKSITNTFDKNNYTQKFTGIGFGVAGGWPIDDQWSLYGSLGFVSGGDVTVDNTRVGSASSGAIEVGTVYTFSESHRFNIGLRNQNLLFKFNNGNSQDSGLSGLFVGYNFLLDL